MAALKKWKLLIDTKSTDKSRHWKAFCLRLQRGATEGEQWSVPAPKCPSKPWPFSDRRKSLAVKMMMMKMFMPSMPEMPGGGEEKKEETAESREEAKEQVGSCRGCQLLTCILEVKLLFYRIQQLWLDLYQERLRQQAIKEKEKERLNFYQKQKEGQKDVRSKYREKVFFSSCHCEIYLYQKLDHS